MDDGKIGSFNIGRRSYPEPVRNSQGRKAVALKGATMSNEAFRGRFPVGDSGDEMDDE